MKPEDIKVGQRYKSMSLANMGDVWLGVGMRKTFCGKFDNTAEFTEKHLVLVECNDPAFIGLMLQEGANSAPHAWDTMYEEGNEEFSGTFYA